MSGLQVETLVLAPLLKPHEVVVDKHRGEDRGLDLFQSQLPTNLLLKLLPQSPQLRDGHQLRRLAVMPAVVDSQIQQEVRRALQKTKGRIASVVQRTLRGGDGARRRENLS